jgi:hypothetical protein
MDVIHTVVRSGQCIMPEVMKGVLHNDCSLCVISSWDKIGRLPNGVPNRKNILQNWNESFKFPYSGYYIGMDSDVVLNPDTIDILRHYIDKGHDLVTCGNIEQCYSQHHVFMASEKVILSIKPDTSDRCPLCSWVDEVKKKFKVFDLPTSCAVHTISRLEIKRVEE